jgi:hypothetical protein
MKDNRDLYKIAHIVHCQLQEWIQAQDRDRLGRLTAYATLTQRLTDLLRQHKKAIAHAWPLAAQRIKSRIAPVWQDLRYTTDNLREISLETPFLPTYPVILDDLLELDRELGPIQFDAQALSLAIVTDTIELRGICLGPFRIELALNQIQTLQCVMPYKCLAEEPYRSRGDQTLTHPHVSGTTLCEGDGKVPIRRALEQGRLYDFFTLITHILNTYNPGSAYSRLEQWEGTPCYDCGHVCDDEDRYICNQCGNDFCLECSSYCQICDETTCLGCGGPCHYCESFLCHDCLARCSACGESHCSDCLEDGLCPECKPESEEHHEPDEEESIPTPGTPTTIQLGPAG